MGPAKKAPVSYVSTKGVVVQIHQRFLLVRGNHMLSRKEGHLTNSVSPAVVLCGVTGREDSQRSHEKAR